MEISVSQLARVVREQVEGLGTLRVRGEVGRVATPSSGHVYFDLKDEGALVNMVVWRGKPIRREFLQEGLEVAVSGKLTTYAPRSSYQMVVEKVEPVGEGALLQQLEKRRRALQEEGLFAAENKKRLPELPRVIGLITSLQGAVLHDVVHRLRVRVGCRLVVWGCAVQGEACAREVSAALDGFSAGETVPRPDVVIVARGGGSMEDLWGFNEEQVVRAVARCTVPVISAVGHEVDTTLCDMAADVRAPTPTAAAETVLPLREEVAGRIERGGEALRRAMQEQLVRKKGRVQHMRWREGGERLHVWDQRLDGMAERWKRAARWSLEKVTARVGRGDEKRMWSLIRSAWRQRMMQVEAMGKRLESVSYEATLKRGFALVLREGRVVKGEEKLAAGEPLTLVFAGRRKVEVEVR